MEKCIFRYLVGSMILLLFASCEIVRDNAGPWIGNWVLINFLSKDDNGVWDGNDDTSGIGETLVVSPEKWVSKNDSDGCEFEHSYTIIKYGNKYRYSKKFVDSSCYGFRLDDSGRLEFSDNNNIMYEYFDYIPGDTLYAFKWMRESAVD